VVCIEAKSTMTFDIHYHVRLISADEYQITTYEGLRGFVSGLYAGNYDISQSVARPGSPETETVNLTPWLLA